MRIQIMSLGGMTLKNAEGGLRFAAECFQECDRDPGCLAPFRIVINGKDEYFAEDVDWMLEEQ